MQGLRGAQEVQQRSHWYLHQLLMYQQLLSGAWITCLALLLLAGSRATREAIALPCRGLLGCHKFI